MAGRKRTASVSTAPIRLELQPLHRVYLGQFVDEYVNATTLSARKRLVVRAAKALLKEYGIKEKEHVSSAKDVVEEFLIRKHQRDQRKAKSDKLDILKEATGKRLFSQRHWSTISPIVADRLKTHKKGQTQYIGVYSSVVTEMWQKLPPDDRDMFDGEAALLNEGKGTLEMKILFGNSCFHKFISRVMELSDRYFGATLFIVSGRHKEIGGEMHFNVEETTPKVKVGKRYMDTVQDPYAINVVDFITYHGGITSATEAIRPDYVLFRHDGEPLLPDYTGALVHERRDIMTYFFRVHFDLAEEKEGSKPSWAAMIRSLSTYIDEAYIPTMPNGDQWSLTDQPKNMEMQFVDIWLAHISAIQDDILTRDSMEPVFRLLAYRDSKGNPQAAKYSSTYMAKYAGNRNKFYGAKNIHPFNASRIRGASREVDEKLSAPGPSKAPTAQKPARAASVLIDPDDTLPFEVDEDEDEEEVFNMDVSSADDDSDDDAAALPPSPKEQGMESSNLPTATAPARIGRSPVKLAPIVTTERTGSPTKKLRHTPSPTKVNQQRTVSPTKSISTPILRSPSKHTTSNVADTPRSPTKRSVPNPALAEVSDDHRRSPIKLDLPPLVEVPSSPSSPSSATPPRIVRNLPKSKMLPPAPSVPPIPVARSDSSENEAIESATVLSSTKTLTPGVSALGKVSSVSGMVSNVDSVSQRSPARRLDHSSVQSLDDIFGAMLQKHMDTESDGSQSPKDQAPVWAKPTKSRKIKYLRALCTDEKYHILIDWLVELLDTCDELPDFTSIFKWASWSNTSAVLPESTHHERSEFQSLLVFFKEWERRAVEYLSFADKLTHFLLVTGLIYRELHRMLFQDDPDVPPYSLPPYASESLLTQELMDALCASFIKIATYIPSLRESLQHSKDFSPPPITSTPVPQKTKPRGRPKRLPTGGESAASSSSRPHRQASPTPDGVETGDPANAVRRTQRERNANKQYLTSEATGSNKRSKTSRNTIADEESSSELPKAKPVGKKGRPKGKK